MKRLICLSASAIVLAACGQPADQAPEESASPVGDEVASKDTVGTKRKSAI